MKKQEKRLKPRNPLVAQVIFKKAGWKEKSRKAQRRDDKIALRRVADTGKSYLKGFFQATIAYFAVAA